MLDIFKTLSRICLKMSYNLNSLCLCPQFVQGLSYLDKFYYEGGQILDKCWTQMGQVSTIAYRLIAMDLLVIDAVQGQGESTN